MYKDMHCNIDRKTVRLYLVLNVIFLLIFFYVILKLIGKKSYVSAFSCQVV